MPTPPFFSLSLSVFANHILPLPTRPQSQPFTLMQCLPTSAVLFLMLSSQFGVSFLILHYHNSVVCVFPTLGIFHLIWVFLAPPVNCLVCTIAHVYTQKNISSGLLSVLQPHPQQLNKSSSCSAQMLLPFCL